MSKIGRLAILTLEFGPRDFGLTPGWDTLFDREKFEELWGWKEIGRWVARSGLFVSLGS